MSKLSIETVNSPTELFNRYPNQDQSQDCFVELDLSSGRMSTRYDPEIGNAVPMDVWHGLVRRYSLPGPILGDVANALMAEIASHAQTILDISTVIWDGNNNVVRTHEPNCEDGSLCDCPIASAEQAITDTIANSVDEYDCVAWTEAEDWYASSGVDDYVARVEAGERIEDVAEDMQTEIDDDNNSGHAEYWWEVEGIPEYLERAVKHAEVTAERIGV